MGSRCQTFLGMLTLLAGMGCGSSHHGQIAVTGSATWNGQPIHQGYVEFTPVDGVGPISGATIELGRFRLNILPGEKLISVRAMKQIGLREPDERIPVAEPILFQFLPEKFNTRSDLRVSIDRTDPSITLDLQGEELPPR